MRKRGGIAVIQPIWLTDEGSRGRKGWTVLKQDGSPTLMSLHGNYYVPASTETFRVRV
jgi:hypothetical protein